MSLFIIIYHLMIGYSVTELRSLAIRFTRRTIQSELSNFEN